MKEKFDDFWKRTGKDKANRTIKTKDIGKNATVKYEVESATYMQQHNNDEKYFVVERIRRKTIEGKLATPDNVKEQGVEYRFGYYIVGKNGNKEGKWTWGQFTPMIPKEDFWNLIEKAKIKGVILETDS